MLKKPTTKEMYIAYLKDKSNGIDIQIKESDNGNTFILLPDKSNGNKYVPVAKFDNIGLSISYDDKYEFSREIHFITQEYKDISKACLLYSHSKEYPDTVECESVRKAGYVNALQSEHYTFGIAYHEDKKSFSYASWHFCADGDGLCYGHYYDDDFTQALNDYDKRAGTMKPNITISCEQLSQIIHMTNDETLVNYSDMCEIYDDELKRRTADYGYYKRGIYPIDLTDVDTAVNSGYTVYELNENNTEKILNSYDYINCEKRYAIEDKDNSLDYIKFKEECARQSFAKGCKADDIDDDIMDLLDLDNRLCR